MFLGIESYVLWAPVVIAGVVVLYLWWRRLENSSNRRMHQERDRAKQRGSHNARLQYPDVDLNLCIGCGLCIQACPENGVLELIHGQAAVVHGARCVGHGKCAEACPTNGIALTFADISTRRDLPALTDEFEAVGSEGLFLAGEITGFALVGTAINQGIAVANAVVNRVKGRSLSGTEEGVHDLIIVGAGPGGLACALRAKEHGLEPVILEQEESLGGTVAGYPRRKMVMTQAIKHPLFGRRPKLRYQKEELVEEWERVSADKGLGITFGCQINQLEKRSDGFFSIETNQGVEVSRTVVLALGRRGTPRKLNVKGEDLDKVSYSLIDAESYQDRNIMVVGGGDSAVEAAVGLSKQRGNRVTLSYRKHAFSRIKVRNEMALEQAISKGSLTVVYESQLTLIEPDRVVVQQSHSGSENEIELPNDEVFIFAGGIPPFALLEQSGVSFDPEDRPAAKGSNGQSLGLLVATTLVFLSIVGMMIWANMHWGYYGLDVNLRPTSSFHETLRPSSLIGISFGIVACVLFVWNLMYLMKKSLRWGRILPGSLQLWMNAHIFTGLFAFLCVLVHSGFSLKNATGGHALLAFGVVVIAGIIGRYLYAFVPRAANGAELNLGSVRSQLTTLSTEWDRQGRGHGEKVHALVEELVDVARWKPGLLVRIWSLVHGQVKLRRSLRRLAREGRAHDIPESDIRQIQTLARRSYRLTLLVTHFEEIRTVMSSWRYIHRWLALLMIILAALHIVTSVRYASIDWSSLMFWRSFYE